MDDVRIIFLKLTYFLTWFDASHDVHPNMRSQTGGLMSMGYGMLNCLSSKKNMNAKSSTEAELIGTSYYVPFNVCIFMFLEAQGYNIYMNIIFQDNQSTISMAKNGRNSCTVNFRHICVDSINNS